MMNVLFITAHPAGQEHFSILNQELSKQKIPAQEWVFDSNNIEAAAQYVSNYGITHLIVDVGNPQVAALLERVAILSPQVCKVAYYDNPESQVPGAYLENTRKIAEVADFVLFANSNLANEGPLPFIPPEKRFGLGFYPMGEIDGIIRDRSMYQEERRALFLQEQGIEDKGQPLVFYFGGANSDYYEKAAPAFASFIGSNKATFVLQQHPRAMKEGDRDGTLLVEKGVIRSALSFKEALETCDVALFYQTSAAAKFALCGIPVLKVGHDTSPDLLTDLNICRSATNRSTFVAELSKLQPKPVERQKILDRLGVLEKWNQRLVELLHQMTDRKLYPRHVKEAICKNPEETAFILSKSFDQMVATLKQISADEIPKAKALAFFTALLGPLYIPTLDRFKHPNRIVIDFASDFTTFTEIAKEAAESIAFTATPSSQED